MQAHICRSVVMDVAAFKVSHSVDNDATALRAARARSSSSIHRGDGGNVAEGSQCEHTIPDASFSYTFELISVAVPSMKSPPPCKPKEQASGVTFHWGDG